MASIPTLSGAFKNKRRPRQNHLPSLPFSVPISASQGGQSFPLLNTADAQGGPQGNNASMSLQRTSTRKVTVSRAQGLVVREMFHRNDVGEQGQRNATHPDRPFSGNHDKGA